MILFFYYFFHQNFFSKDYSLDFETFMCSFLLSINWITQDNGLLRNYEYDLLMVTLDRRKLKFHFQRYYIFSLICFFFSTKQKRLFRTSAT
jgi:hypothetical protein